MSIPHASTPVPAPAFAADAPLSIVVNAGSGRDDADAACATIADVLAAAGRRHTLHRVDDPRRLDELTAAAGVEADLHGGAIVAAGGDGTVSAVAAHAIERGLPFGALPQGTFNLFGRAHGLSQDI